MHCIKHSVQHRIQHSIQHSVQYSVQNSIQHSKLYSVECRLAVPGPLTDTAAGGQGVGVGGDAYWGVHAAEEKDEERGEERDEEEDEDAGGMIRTRRTTCIGRT